MEICDIRDGPYLMDICSNGHRHLNVLIVQKFGQLRDSLHCQVRIILGTEE